MNKVLLLASFMFMGCEELPTDLMSMDANANVTSSDAGKAVTTGNCNGTNNCNNNKESPKPPVMSNQKCKLLCESKHWSCWSHCSCDKDRLKCDHERENCHVVCDRDCR